MLPVEKFPKRWRRSAEEKGGKPSRGRRVFVGRVRAFPPELVHGCRCSPGSGEAIRAPP